MTGRPSFLHNVMQIEPVRLHSTQAGLHTHATASTMQAEIEDSSAAGHKQKQHYALLWNPKILLGYAMLPQVTKRITLEPDQ